MIKSGRVVLEKLIKIISQLGRLFKVVINVIVLPEPGGPQIIKARCSLIQLPKTI